MTTSLADRLQIDPVDDDVWCSHEPTDPEHVFGGLLVAQALRAGQLTVDPDRDAHSLHASFVTAGAGGQPIRYEVERTRDGVSFSTRRVVARQDHGVVMVLTADFHHEEPGLDYAAPPAAGVPDPDELGADRRQSRVFESRTVPDTEDGDVRFHTRRAWFRSRTPLPDDPHLHLQALAYLSDHGPARAARAPHSALPRSSFGRALSLDHSVWFHRPVSLDDWVLYELVPVATGRGRGLSFGTLRTRDRVLVATVAQEVLLRTA